MDGKLLPYIIITSATTAPSSLSFRAEFLITFVTLIGNKNCFGVETTRNGAEQSHLSIVVAPVSFELA